MMLSPAFSEFSILPAALSLSSTTDNIATVCR